MKLAYAYHCMPPTSGREHLLAEHERCVELWDELVDIERATERRIEEAAATRDPDVAAARKEIVDLSATIHAVPRAERDPLYRARNEARKRVWDGIKRWRREHKEEARAIESERQARVKAARQAVTVHAESEQQRLYWPNSNDVLARYEAGRAGARKMGRRLRYHDSGRDDGQLAVQIQRTASGLGAAPDELDSLSMLRIEPVPAHAYERGVPRKLRNTMVTMRVDAAGNTVSLPVLMHRPPPAGCRIKGAKLCWHTDGLGERWTLVLQLADVPREAPVAYRASGAIELAWEKDAAGGLLVARPNWRSPYALPADWVRAGVRLREQQSWLDRSLNEQRDLADDATKALLAGAQRTIYALRREQLPESMREWLTSWRRLWWQTQHGRRKWLKRRQWIYRQWAREIVRERPDLAIDDRRLDRIARSERGSESNSWRQMACVHDLRAEIVHQANKIGARVVAGDSASGRVLTEDGREKSGAWQRRKAAKQDRSQERPEA